MFVCIRMLNNTVFNEISVFSSFDHFLANVRGIEILSDHSLTVMLMLMLPEATRLSSDVAERRPTVKKK